MHHVTEYSPAKTGEYLWTFPNFKNCACCEKYLKDNKHKSLHLARKYINNSLHLARKYALIFVRGHYQLREANSLSFEKQIMSLDKYPSIFSCLMEAVVYIFPSFS